MSDSAPPMTDERATAARIDAKVEALMAEATAEAQDNRGFVLPAVDYGQRSNERKRELLRKNPLVPLGALLTAGVLLGGLMQFRRGNTHQSQMFMRYRVLAQGATIGVASLSVLFTEQGWLSKKSTSPEGKSTE
mmetsp:Transcript_18566/g.45694  ORF Transcript_18566/g.45694 Transcript_18566/m.45694 type:complete len:134 (+) Transcript_18566:155-556(+)